MSIARIVAPEWQTDGYLKLGKIVGVRRPTTEEFLRCCGIGKKGRVRGEVQSQAQLQIARDCTRILAQCEVGSDGFLPGDGTLLKSTQSANSSASAARRSSPTAANNKAA